MADYMFLSPDRDDSGKNYASDSSIGLYATDNEGAGSGSESSSREVIYPLQYESGNESHGEISRLEIVNENRATRVSNNESINNHNHNHNHNPHQHQNQHQNHPNYNHNQNHNLNNLNNHNHNHDGHQFICNKCPLYERKIFEVWYDYIIIIKIKLYFYV